MSLSERERELLDTIAQTLDVKMASEKIGISPGTAYNMLYRIRNKQLKARKLVNTILGYRRKSYKLDMVLSKRLTTKEELELTQER